MHMNRGLRDYLENYADTSKNIKAEIFVSGNLSCRYMCICTDKNDVISDKKYIISDNMPVSPKNEIKYSLNNNIAEFDISLGTLPDSAEKLLFAVSIEDEGTMNMIQSSSFSIIQNNEPLLSMELKGSDFRAEKALVFIELYRKDGKWRFSVVARGFYGGISELLKLYGFEENDKTHSDKSESDTPESNEIQSEEVQADEIKSTEIQSEEIQPNEPTQNDIQADEPKSNKMPEPIFIKSDNIINEKTCLTKGEVFPIPQNNAEFIRIESGCTSGNRKYDLKILVRYRNGNLIYAGFDEDEAASTPENAVICNSENGCINVRWHADIASIAVCSCSLNLNEPSVFKECGAFVRFAVGKQTIEIIAADTDSDINCNTLCFGELLFGEMENQIDISALEMYGGAYSLNRIGYMNDKIVMDSGPYIQRKNFIM